MSEQNTTCCPCEPEKANMLSLGNFTLGLFGSSCGESGGGLSREEILQLIREELQNISVDDLAKPNMEIGVEVKLNRRVDGKQLYAQLINFGALPNTGTKSVEHNIPDVDWINVDPTYSRVIKDTNAHPINFSHTTSVGGNWTYYANRTHIDMFTGSNRSDRSAIICLNYTKMTDTPI